jgi:hypothetical protein
MSEKSFSSTCACTQTPIKTIETATNTTRLKNFMLLLCVDPDVRTSGQQNQNASMGASAKGSGEFLGR